MVTIMDKPKRESKHFVICHTHFLTYSGICHTYFLALLPLDFLAVGLADSTCPLFQVILGIRVYRRKCIGNRSCGEKGRKKKNKIKLLCLIFSSLRNVNGTLQGAFVIFICKPLCISICYGCHGSCSYTLDIQDTISNLDPHLM